MTTHDCCAQWCMLLPAANTADWLNEHKTHTQQAEEGDKEGGSSIESQESVASLTAWLRAGAAVHPGLRPGPELMNMSQCHPCGSTAGRKPIGCRPPWHLARSLSFFLPLSLCTDPLCLRCVCVKNVTEHARLVVTYSVYARRTGCI